VSARVDGSSRFGAGHRYGFFPSAAFAWRASDEEFVKRLGLFNDLKLRASYGRTGNQEIGNYKSLALLANTVHVFGGVRGIGFARGEGWGEHRNMRCDRDQAHEVGAGRLVMVACPCVGGGADQYCAGRKVGQPVSSFYGWGYAGAESARVVYTDLDGATVIT